MSALRDFKAALGLDDFDAAAVHLEHGRRLKRQRDEAGDKAAEAAARRAFQRLVFVSNTLFGAERSAFMLPWRRLFDLSDAQIALALKDSGVKLFRDRLSAVLPDAAPDAGALASLEAFRASVALDPSAAADALASACRARVEAAAGRAHAGLTARTRARDVAGAMAELEAIIDYNRALTALKADSAAQPGSLPPGLGPVSLFGGAYDAPAKFGELKELFRMYVAERMRGGAFTPDSVQRASELRLAFGMGAKEANAVAEETAGKVYRLTLKAWLADGGRLRSAASPAAELEALCSALQFPPAAAEAVHGEVFRAALEAAMAPPARALSPADDDAVSALRRLLCLPPASERAARREVCGEAWRPALNAALSAGPDGFSAALLAQCDAARARVRLPEDIAVEILSESVRRVWMATVRSARAQPSRLDCAKELKQLVLFNAAVVTPLLASVRGAGREAAAREIADLLQQAQAQAAADAADVAALSAAASPTRAVPPQTEITLRADLPLPQRQELYKTFLVFCMTGDTVAAPMGSTITLERDPAEFTRLSQLGDVLGLSPADCGAVHSGLAEQAYRANAQQLLGGEGVMTADKAAQARALGLCCVWCLSVILTLPPPPPPFPPQLKQLQTQLGLPDAVADPIVASMQQGKAAASLQALLSSGKLTLDDVEALAASGAADVAASVPPDARMALLRREVERALSAGTGAWDAARFADAAPRALALDPARCAAEVRSLAAEKRRSQLVQAVALLRQRDAPAARRCLANLRAAGAALAAATPGGPRPPALSWPVRDELLDLYSVEAAAGAGPGALADVADALGLDGPTCAELRAVVDAGGFSLQREAAGEERLY